MSQARTTVEAKIYHSTNRLTVVAPMPGLLPEDITVNLAGATLTVAAGRAEYEPRYRCHAVLPAAVDGASAVAAYAYGVLVVAMPLIAPADSPLDALGPGLVKRHSGTEALSPKSALPRDLV